MRDLLIGVHVVGRTASEVVEGIAAAEEAGIDCAWMTSGGAAVDPLVVFGAAAMRTSRIRFGTSIIPTFPRHPLALVQAASAVDSLAPGRLRLGVGPSHKPSIEGTWGIPFERPLQHLQKYLIDFHRTIKYLYIIDWYFFSIKVVVFLNIRFYVSTRKTLQITLVKD